MKQLLHTVRVWGEMIKFSHSVFALPFALMAAFLAARSADPGHPYPSPGQLLLILGCMVSARSAAMTFNRLVDAEIDARNPRTAVRAIPAGAISRGRATLFFLIVGSLFLLCCAGFWWLDRNVWPVALALPVLAYLCFYSYTKRFTTGSHFVLGSAIALSPVAAWLAIHPASLGWSAVILSLAVTFWIGGFDIIYACQDVTFDCRDRLKSLPARLGVRRALWVARGAHAVTVILLVLLMSMANLGGLYGTGVGLVGVLLVIENALVRADDLSRVNVAFFTINGVISLALAVLTIMDCIL